MAVDPFVVIIVLDDIDVVGFVDVSVNICSVGVEALLAEEGVEDEVDDGDAVDDVEGETVDSKVLGATELDDFEELGVNGDAVVSLDVVLVVVFTDVVGPHVPQNLEQYKLAR